MKLVIEVSLGNDSMQTASDASNALAKSLVQHSAGLFDPLQPHEEGTIRDDNGNTVGSWNVED